ncbi:MAG: RDD family protein [Rhizobacter sp.]|nr:RDD family protein [Bacteriovorax sp.]
MKSEISILQKRVYAFTADLAIITTCNYFLMAAGKSFISTMFFHFPVKFQLILIDKIEVMSSISLMSLSFAYFSLFYFLTNGHTMGKSFFGLRVKNEDGSEMTLNQSMYRALAYFTCAMTGSFLFALSFIRKDEKSLADVFSGTFVVSDKLAESVGTEFQLTLVKELAASEEETEYFEENKAA